jgi:hypothetical protein
MDTENLTDKSVSHALTLEDVLQRLRQQEVVDAALLVGTTGGTIFSTSSDYDLLIVLKENPENIFKVVTTIADQLAELYFVESLALDEILRQQQPVHANSFLSLVIAWAASGIIAFDRSGKLTRLQEVAQNAPLTEIPDQHIYETWYSLNYNLKQNLRYARSSDQLHLQALRFRLLYCIYDCLTGYFGLRKLAWRGEKEAIQYLQRNDRPFLELFTTCSEESDFDKKFELYKRLVQLTIPAEMGIWASSRTAIKLQDLFTETATKRALDFWKSLVTR